MQRREKKKLRQLRPRPPPDPEQLKARQRGVLRRLLGFWLFHKIIGGDS